MSNFCYPSIIKKPATPTADFLSMTDVRMMPDITVLYLCIVQLKVLCDHDKNRILKPDMITVPFSAPIEGYDRFCCEMERQANSVMCALYGMDSIDDLTKQLHPLSVQHDIYLNNLVNYIRVNIMMLSPAGVTIPKFKKRMRLYFKNFPLKNYSYSQTLTVLNYIG